MLAPGVVMSSAEGISQEERDSFTFGGQRARPRKGIERKMLEDQTYLKPPGSCLTKYPDAGVNVAVECCERCNIFVLDPCAQVQVSECTDCRIIIGPCAGPVLIFDCIGCTIAVAGKQIRLRDCSGCSLRTYAPTQECIVIETSKNLQFGAWDVAYAGLAAQFKRVGWAAQATTTNFWDAIYDFSPSAAGPKNWQPLAGVDGAGRWCELEIVPDGLSAGVVVERRSDTPSGQGCECPSAAQDGALYTAQWFAAEGAAASAASEQAADAEASAAAKATATSTADVGITLGGEPKPARAATGGGGGGGGGIVGMLRALCTRLLGGGKPAAYPAVSGATGSAKPTTQVCAIS